jgi:hypothetical protein
VRLDACLDTLMVAIIDPMIALIALIAVTSLFGSF